MLEDHRLQAGGPIEGLAWMHSLAECARRDCKGDDVPLPPAFPMGRVPEGGWANGGLNAPTPEVQQVLAAFNTHFSEMLRALQAAWFTGDSDMLFPAIGHMGGMRTEARKLVQLELPDGSGKTYGPEFLYVEE